MNDWMMMMCDCVLRSMLCMFWMCDCVLDCDVMVWMCGSGLSEFWSCCGCMCIEIF